MWPRSTKTMEEIQNPRISVTFHGLDLRKQGNKLLICGCDLIKMTKQSASKFTNLKKN